MRVLVVGIGDVGKAVLHKISNKHTVLTASRTSGDLCVDIEDTASIKKMYAEAGPLDAVVCTLGKAHFGPLKELNESHFIYTFHNKIMGQIRLVTAGIPHLNTQGSFTLTSGILSDDPVPMSICAATANGALNAFVRATANELPKSLRINIVSPTLLEASIERYGPYFPGYMPVSDEAVAMAYCKSMEGLQNGQIYRVGYV